jgi:predicted transcriptional regulator
MRLHISLDNDLVEELDSFAGRRQRSAFIARSVKQTLAEERRWANIESALGAIDDRGHEWDDDPASWVRRGRREDAHRAG